MKRTLALLLTLCLLAALPVFASAEQVNSISIYTCYVENEALQMFEQFTKVSSHHHLRLLALLVQTRQKKDSFSAHGLNR